MSNATAQSATQQTISGQTEENFDFMACAKRASNKAITKTSMTRERASLNRQSLISVCKEDYRVHFAAIYGKTDKLPSVVFEKIEKAVDEVICERLSELTPSNTTSYRRSVVFKESDLGFVERITLIGENTMAMKEQRLFCDIAINLAEKRLADLEAKITPNHELEKSVRQRIVKLQTAKNFIEGELKHQESLVAPTAT